MSEPPGAVLGGRDTREKAVRVGQGTQGVPKRQAEGVRNLVAWVPVSNRGDRGPSRGPLGSPLPLVYLIPRHTQVCMHARLTILSALCPEAQGNTHIFTHTPRSISAITKQRQTHQRGAGGRRRPHAVRHYLVSTITHTQDIDRARDTKTADECGCFMACVDDVYRNTKTGLCPGHWPP